MSAALGSAVLRTQSDARLLELASAGHERAFEAIVVRYRRPLERSVRRMLPPALVEDVVQSALVAAWSALAAGAAVRELRPWLHAIARNAAVRALAGAGEACAHLSEQLPGAGSAADAVALREDARAALAAVAGLPARQREALLRTVFDGDSRAQIALDLEAPEGTVRQLVHRARTSVRAAATAIVPLPLIVRVAAGEATAGAATTAAASASAGKAAAIVVAAAAVAAGGAAGYRWDPAPTRATDAPTIRLAQPPTDASTGGTGASRPIAFLVPGRPALVPRQAVPAPVAPRRRTDPRRPAARLIPEPIPATPKSAPPLPAPIRAAPFRLAPF